MASVNFASAPPRDLDLLLKENSSKISDLRRSLGPVLPHDYDDIWLLRFVLSNPDPTKCLDAASKCIAWRSENADLIRAVTSGQPHEAQSKIAPHLVYGMHGTSIYGEPLIIIRAGLCNFAAVIAATTPAQLHSYLMFIRERNFQACDAATRSRRQLVKMVCAIDMTHAHLGLFDRPFSAAVGASNKVSDIIYPQLLGRYM